MKLNNMDQKLWNKQDFGGENGSKNMRNWNQRTYCVTKFLCIGKNLEFFGIINLILPLCTQRYAFLMSIRFT